MTPVSFLSWSYVRSIYLHFLIPSRTVAVFDPKETWVGKWQGIQKKGTYAITIAVTEQDIKKRDYDKDDGDEGEGAYEE